MEAMLSWDWLETYSKSDDIVLIRLESHMRPNGTKSWWLPPLMSLVHVGKSCSYFLFSLLKSDGPKVGSVVDRDHCVALTMQGLSPSVRHPIMIPAHAIRWHFAPWAREQTT
jgi:hypothetical protein